MPLSRKQKIFTGLVAMQFAVLYAIMTIAFVKNDTLVTIIALSAVSLVLAGAYAVYFQVVSSTSKKQLDAMTWKECLGKFVPFNQT